MWRVHALDACHIRCHIGCQVDAVHYSVSGQISACCRSSSGIYVNVVNGCVVGFTGRQFRQPTGNIDIKHSHNALFKNKAIGALSERDILLSCIFDN